MKILQVTVLALLMAVGMSSCIVAGPGYYRRGPGFHGHHGPRGGHYHQARPHSYHGHRR